jgi:hypothetical protein
MGVELVAAAKQLVENAGADVDAPGKHESDEGALTFVTSVRNWASTLDRDTYKVYEEDGQVYIQSAPPADVQAALEPGTQDLQRGQEATRLVWRYLTERRAHPERATPFAAEELARDLATAKALRDDPPSLSATGMWDAPIAVSAAALEAHFLSGIDTAPDQLQFAVETVIAVAEGADPPDKFESSESYFEQGSDRVAARVVPLLLLPEAATSTGEDGQPLVTRERVVDAARRLAQSIAHETRLHLARGLDPLWQKPCGGDPCHHELALRIALDASRDCVLGGWDSSTQKRRIDRLEDPVDEAIRRAPDDLIYVAKLDPAIRSLAVAATSGTCVSERAREIFIALLDGQRRGLLAHDNMDHRGSHALIAARALLALAASGDEAPLQEHVAAYADNGGLLSALLHALAAAAEENDRLAAAARRCWPQIIRHVLGYHDAGRAAFGDHHYGETSLAALMPRPMSDWLYLYREIESTPRQWADVHAWRAEIDSWVIHAVGKPECVDSLIGLLLSLSLSDQASIGLPWVASISLADAEPFARRSWLLATWLIDVRSAAADAGKTTVWQELVDALVVAGENRLAPYSE